MATKYEYYDTGGDTQFHIYQVKWAAQTFTPAIAHTITSVKLFVSRQNTAGTKRLYVYIRATDGAGKPTGGNLASGSIAASDIGTGYSWKTISLGAGYQLSAGTKYAIVCYYNSINSSYYIRWQGDNAGATYAGGIWLDSPDSGSTWTASGGRDFYFEDWGDPLPSAPAPGGGNAGVLVGLGQI